MIFAVLGVYFVAFKVLMTVKAIDYGSGAHGPRSVERMHMPRWMYSNKYHLFGHWMDTFFAPLIWVERQVRSPEYWTWHEGQPEPEWLK